MTTLAQKLGVLALLPVLCLPALAYAGFWLLLVVGAYRGLTR